jgi:hypothetical protein
MTLIHKINQLYSLEKKRKKQKTSSYASNVSHKKYETRKRPKNGSHAVHAMDEKFEKHHQSMAKPRSVTMPNEIHEKCHRSTVLPSVSLDLPAPILIRRNGGREHGLAMLAQRFYVIVSKEASTSYITCLLVSDLR